MSLPRVVLRAIEFRRFGRKTKVVRSANTKMAIRFGVYFDESNPMYGNTVLRKDREEGKAIRRWLRDNISGKWSVQTSYVFFEDEADAMLCYLAFKG